MGRLLVGLVSTVLLAQQQPQGAGVLSGIVLDEITGLPVPGAGVGIGLVTELKLAASTRTDLEGKFRLSGIRAGRYWIEYSASGYVKVEGSRIDSPQADVPASGEPSPVTVRLTPAASIEGSLLTERGAPIIGARVENVKGDFGSLSDSLGHSASTAWLPAITACALGSTIRFARHKFRQTLPPAGASDCRSSPRLRRRSQWVRAST
jgi:hypothetical protein